MRFLCPLLTATLLSTASLALAQSPEPAAAASATPTASPMPSASPATRRVRHKKMDTAPTTASPTPADGAAPAASPRAGKMTREERRAANQERMSKLAAATPAPGGGPGMVWVNTKSKVYHASSSPFYGKTKEGKYMTEEAAKAEGDHEAKAEIGAAKPKAQ